MTLIDTFALIEQQGVTPAAARAAATYAGPSDHDAVGVWLRETLLNLYPVLDSTDGTRPTYEIGFRTDLLAVALCDLVHKLNYSGRLADVFVRDDPAHFWGPNGRSGACGLMANVMAHALRSLGYGGGATRVSFIGPKHLAPDGDESPTTHASVIVQLSGFSRPLILDPTVNGAALRLDHSPATLDEASRANWVFGQFCNDRRRDGDSDRATAAFASTIPVFFAIPWSTWSWKNGELIDPKRPK